MTYKMAERCRRERLEWQTRIQCSSLYFPYELPCLGLAVALSDGDDGGYYWRIGFCDTVEWSILLISI